MIGCLLLLPLTGFFMMLGVYITSMMAFFGTLGAAMSVYMAGVASYFTAFFIIMFG